MNFLYEPMVDSSRRQSNVFLLTLYIILVILGLIALSYIFNIKVKTREAKEGYQNLEDQYESSKNHQNNHSIYIQNISSYYHCRLGLYS
jgi:hypothetical protein